ncbi:MAG: 50S ribosomal protein L7/L12 [Methanomassiliicoccaceae archaeon]|nr:50S ribosomal protein L7/L12 [Methanomassiliicoccaceae archaeon]
MSPEKEKKQIEETKIQADSSLRTPVVATGPEIGDAKIVNNPRDMKDLTLSEFFELIKDLPIRESAGLIRALLLELDIKSVLSSDDPVPRPAPVDPADNGVYDVILLAYGDRKVEVLNVVRAVTGLGLKDGKDLVESAPKTVKSNVSRSEAEDIKARLEEAGATAQIRLSG